MPDEIGEIELEAYADGELDLGRRLAVESFLAARPARAARMMETLRAHTALRLLSGRHREDDAASELAPRLQRALAARAKRSRRALWPGMAAAAGGVAGLLMAALLVLPNSSASAGQPAYIAEAAMSYQTGRLRASMASQPESRELDPAEIQRAMRIRIPRLPRGWEVTDVQIFPSDDGPALQIMIRTPERESISLFAVRGGSGAPRSPVAVRQGDTSVAYWRDGDVSYAIAGMQAPEAVDGMAEHVAADGIG